MVSDDQGIGASHDRLNGSQRRSSGCSRGGVHRSWPALTRKRVTASEKKQRHEWAVRQIDAGMGLSELTAFTAETWGCSRRQARDVVAAAHKDWLDACYGSEEIDQWGLLFQQVGRLERIARKAENAGQFSAAVGAITALNRMMALGADQKGFRGHSSHHYRR